MADVDPLNRRVVEQMLVGVATRRYARSLEPVPTTMRSRGTSKSAVSRRFVAKTAAQLAAWLDQGHLLDLHALVPRHHLDDPATLLAAHAACDRTRDGARLELREREAGRPRLGDPGRAEVRCALEADDRLPEPVLVGRRRVERHRLHSIRVADR